MQLYIEGYLQAMLDAMYKQEYLRVRVIDDQVCLYLYICIILLLCLFTLACEYVTSIDNMLLSRWSIMVLILSKWIAEETSVRVDLSYIIKVNIQINTKG